MTRSGRTLGALAALALAVPACVLKNPLPTAPRPSTFEGEWAASRDRYARSAKLYDGFTTRAFVYAVYQAPEVRRARVERLAVWRAMTAEEKARLADEERSDGEKWDDFLVSVFTADRADNDLDARASIWRVALVVTGEGDALPASVTQVRSDATIRELYPGVGDFDTVYRVRFPRWKAPLVDRRFALELAGARGRLDLRFGGATP